MPAALYPLQFQPVFRRYIWGGRRLGTVLNKPIGPESDFAESWEVVDHGKDQSVVASGPLTGFTLNQVVREFPRQLFGSGNSFPSFPLLFKFLDARQNLSVQVHPNDGQARLRTPPDFGKTEAWVVLDAEPGSKVYAGLKRGFDRPALERELVRGTVELCLHHIQPKPGDCIFIPAGTVHALGSGLLIAEIQQSSDVTFRLFDWNRVDATGIPRALHLDEGLQAIDFERGPVRTQQPMPTECPYRERLVVCDKFVLDRCRFADEVRLGGDQRFHIVSVLSGCIELPSAIGNVRLEMGQTVLLPGDYSSPPGIALKPAVVLDAYLPDEQVHNR